MYDKSLVTKERLDAIRKIRAEKHNEYFEYATGVIGKEASDALRDLYSIYDEKIYLWLAGLWDPEIGAFYYSESARDVEGFLPDIESTVQAKHHLGSAGLLTSTDGKVPAEMSLKMANYAYGLQDEDGFFYHPQWGKNITVPRRGRDLGWANAAIREGGLTPKYPTPSDRKPEGESPSALLPEHLRTLDAWKKYLSELDLLHSSYSVGNLIQSQNGQITAAGKEFLDELFSWYERNQNTENGTWQDEVCYSSTNGLMKVALMYAAHSRPFPNPTLSAKAAIDVILLDNLKSAITSFYNPWITIGIILGNLDKFGKNEEAECVRKMLKDNLPEMLRMTKRKVEQFKKPDGGFSYNISCSSRTSQGAIVAMPEAREGDVNGNGLASTGVVRNVCSAIGLEPLAFFIKEDSELFFELIAASYQAPKISQEEYAKRVAEK